MTLQQFVKIVILFLASYLLPCALPQLIEKAKVRTSRATIVEKWIPGSEVLCLELCRLSITCHGLTFDPSEGSCTTYKLQLNPEPGPLALWTNEGWNARKI